jgi:hypothetical protein
MRRSDLILVVVLIALAGFVAMQALGVLRTAPPPPRIPATSIGSTAPTSANETVVATAGLAAPQRDLPAIRKRLAEHEHGTFIGEILAARDSLLARWMDRKSKPITVWIDEQSPLVGPDQALASNVRRAFSDWGQAGVPLAFMFVGSSNGAEVKVSFVDHFDRQMSGLTLWTRDPNGWILGGTIQLSLRTGSGHLLNSDQLYAIALHEVGHMLGLDHTSDTTAIMTPRVSALALTPKDVATMQLIYELPPGSVKAAR